MSAPKEGVVAVIDDGAGRLLFIRRGATLVRSPGAWCFVGGELHDGEDPAAAAGREAREEVGLAVRVGGLIHESLSPDGVYRLRWFQARPEPAGQALAPHPVEVDEARWLTPSEGLSLDPLLPGLKAWLGERVRTGRPRSP
jgi:8-oxo-dGTP pyrophosphatase MutT (NUDIX family)